MFEALRQAAEWLGTASRTVVLTGAGISMESGVPDFRSRQGFWAKFEPEEVASVESLGSNYDLLHEFYSKRMESLTECLPNQGHHLLMDWQRKGLIHYLATQNVDGLHQAAGCEQVAELHGSIRSVRCNVCSAPAAMNDFLAKRPCTFCQGKLRPNIVLFGEELPKETWTDCLAAIKESDVVLVIGTSLKVSPVNRLPAMTDGRLILLNAEPTAMDNMFDCVIHGKAGESLRQLDVLINTNR